MVDVLVLLGSERGDGVVDGEAAHNQRRAARHPADGHQQAAFEAEYVARGDLVEEAEPPPQRADAFEQDARAGLRRFRLHELRRALPQSPGAGDDRCDDHADDEQCDACRPVQPIVFELYAGHRVQSLDHQQQERRNAEEADHQSQSAAD